MLYYTKKMTDIKDNLKSKTEALKAVFAGVERSEDELYRQRANIVDMKEAVANGSVITDLSQINLNTPIRMGGRYE